MTPVRPNRIYLSPPAIGEDEVARVVAALRSGWVAPLGPEVDGFEQDICDFTDVGHATALSSGTAALHLALLQIGVSQGDRVYCPTLTFGATAFAITYTGARPVFIDSESTSWNLSPELLRSALEGAATSNNLPVAIVTVDLFGRTCDYDQIMAIANEYAVPVIEDAAEALGAVHHGSRGDIPAGGFGVAGVFSFNGNKIMTTSGGGMLVSNDEQIIAKARHWATQSRDEAPWYEHSEIGYNYRMSNILAALGRAQLVRLPDMIAKRRQIHGWYTELLSDIHGITVMGDPPWGVSNCWLTTARFDRAIHPEAPTRLRETLERQDIEARNVWKPMHRQPIFSGEESHLNGTADAIFAESLCLPSGGAMSRSDVERVSSAIADTLAE